MVEPRIGALPELIDMTGGGVLYEGRSADAVAQALEPLLTDRQKAMALGALGRQGVIEHFNIKDIAASVAELCQQMSR